MMAHLTRPATPKAVPVAREVMAKGSKPVEKKIEKKVVKVAKKIPVIPPKPDLANGHSNWSTSEWLESIDEGGWVDDRRVGLGDIEQDLANDYWMGIYEQYLKNGGTLDFKQFMQQQNKKTSSRDGIQNILKI